MTTVTSREETLTDILPASVTSQLENINNVEQTNGPQLGSVNPSGEAEEDVVIQSTIAPSLASAQGFTYYTTKYDGDSTIVETILSTSGPVSTAVPEIQSGEADVDVISVSTIATPTSGSTISPTSSFEDLDNDLHCSKMRMTRMKMTMRKRMMIMMTLLSDPVVPGDVSPWEDPATPSPP